MNLSGLGEPWEMQISPQCVPECRLVVAWEPVVDWPLAILRLQVEHLLHSSGCDVKLGHCKSILRVGLP